VYVFVAPIHVHTRTQKCHEKRIRVEGSLSCLSLHSFCLLSSLLCENSKMAPSYSQLFVRVVLCAVCCFGAFHPLQMVPPQVQWNIDQEENVHNLIKVGEGNETCELKIYVYMYSTLIHDIND
jgi:hypothetical protein